MCEVAALLVLAALIDSIADANLWQFYTFQKQCSSDNQNPVLVTALEMDQAFCKLFLKISLLCVRFQCS